MKRRWLSLIIGATALVLGLGGAGLGGGAGSVTAATSGVWIQTLDSCRNALGGARYDVAGTGIIVTTPANPPATISPAPTCPVRHGDCVSTDRGCVSLPALAPGTYRIRETATPPADASNPQGYAPCEGGSACRSQVATLTIGSGGNVTKASVISVYPDGSTQTVTFAGTASDPIVFHNFGLGSGSCDGDGDADDHLTGSPSSHCAYPEGQESSACQPYPWSCTMQTDDDLFVAAAYTSMLGRGVDPGALAYWTGRLDSGTPRAALAMSLATSPEYRTDVIGGSVASGVRDFYELYLHRAADPGGIAYWVNRMAGIGGPALSFEQVRLQFAGSIEFSQVTNHGDPSTIIDALYRDLLDRAPDALGKAYWMAHFDVDTIAAQFLYSPEGREVLVQGYYHTILGRSADAAGLAYWTQQLLAGASDENIITDILGSPEYLMKAAG